MITELTYSHNRNVFIKDDWKPFINKYFENVKFLGFESGRYEPSISITNWEEVKDKLPKSYQPHMVNGVLNPLHPKYKEMKEYQDEMEEFKRKRRENGN